MRILSLIFCLVLLLPAAGCADSGSSTEGTDWQYKTDCPSFLGTVQEVSEGYYVQSGHMLYFIDRHSRELFPLCSRVGCLHDQEPDFRTMLDCSAYFPFTSASDCFTVYNGHIYASIAADGPSQEVLQVDPDGQNRRLLYRFTGGEWIHTLLAHRGTLYLLMTCYDENADRRERICTLDLGSPAQTPAVLCSIDVGLSIQAMRAYGRYLYLHCYDDSLSYSSARYLRVDTVTGDVLTLPLPEEGWYPGFMTFFGDRLLFSALQDDDAEDRTLCRLFSCALDGSDVRELYRDHGFFVSDGDYIYWIRYFLPTIYDYPNGVGDLALIVLDMEGREVDRVPLDTQFQKRTVYEIIAMPGEQFILGYSGPGETEAERMHMLYTFPKSEIGSGAITPEFLCGVPLR